MLITPSLQQVHHRRGDGAAYAERDHGNDRLGGDAFDNGARELHISDFDFTECNPRTAEKLSRFRRLLSRFVPASVKIRCKELSRHHDQ